jgi:hypothetical protein
MKRFPPLALAAVAVCLVAAVMALTLPLGAERPATPATAGEPVAHTAGYTIQIDPSTGKLLEPWPNDAPMVLNKELNNALSTSSEGLTEVASPVAGGGVMVDLQGRFRNTITATTNDGCALETNCGPGHSHDADASADTDEGSDRR